MKDPKKYDIGPKRKTFNTTLFWGWIFYALIHSVIVFIIYFYMLHLNMFPNGMAVDFWHSGAMLLTSIVFLVNVVILRDYSNQTLPGFLLIVLMLAIHVLFEWGISLVDTDVLYLIFETVWGNSHLYLGAFFACGLVFSAEKMVVIVFDLLYEKFVLMRRRRIICKEPMDESNSNRI